MYCSLERRNVFFKEMNCYLIPESYVFFQKKNMLPSKASSEHKHSLENEQRIDHLEMLEMGHYLVHIQHGIGRFEGMKILGAFQVQKLECLQLTYAENAILYVPVSDLNLLVHLQFCQM